jgi:hypothetical protein
MILGIISFVCLQVVWCCRMGQCGLITIATLSVLAGICSIIAAILILVAGTEPLCEENITDDEFTVSQCTVGLNTYVGIAFVSGILWIAISGLVFAFGCGDEFKNMPNREMAAAKEADAVEVVEQPASAAADSTTNNPEASDKA